jgi:hypothetical protein
MAFADRPRLVEQNEERGLEGIVAIRFLVEKPLTHAADHRPVPGHQIGQSRFIVPIDEAREELAIACSFVVYRSWRPASAKR